MTFRHALLLLLCALITLALALKEWAPNLIPAVIVLAVARFVGVI